MEQAIGALLKAITDAGPIAIALLFAVFGLWWVGTGRGRVGSLVDKAMDALIAMYDKRIIEIGKERDDWKALAQGIGPEVKRLNDLLDTAVKLLLDRRPPE